MWRGAVVLAVLKQLMKAQYGYSLRQALLRAGIPVEEGTLYPLLRRLESQGLLSSEWRIEDGPPRRYYQLNPAGGHALANLSKTWRALTAAIDSVLADSSQ